MTRSSVSPGATSWASGWFGNISREVKSAPEIADVRLRVAKDWPQKLAMDRNLTRLFASLALTSLLLRADDHGQPATPPEAPHPEAHAPTPHSATEVKTARLLRETALALLKEGNARFASGRPQHPHLDGTRRHDLARHDQTPLATVLACSDSVVPPELIFDRGLGDFYVVRVAGHVAAEPALASVQFGVAELNTPLLIVLGHSHCSALAAAAGGTLADGSLANLAPHLEPAVTAARLNPVPNLLAAAVRANVTLTATRLVQDCPEVRAAAVAGRLTVLGAICDLDTGAVEWLNPLADSQPAPVSFVRPAPAPAPAPALPAHAAPVPPPAHHHDEEATAAAAAHEETPHAAEPAHAPAKTAKPAPHHPAPAAFAADPDADLELARTPRPQAAPPAVVPRTESGKRTIKAPAKPNRESLLLNPPVSSTTPIGGVARHQAGTTKDNH